MADLTPFPDPEATPPRRPLRPLHGIPDPETRGRAGWIVSGLLHGLIILSLLLPPLVGKILEEQGPTGAGGQGPSGGGGGGSGGDGGQVTPERIRYLHVQTAEPAAPPPPKPVETPAAVPTPPPEPVPEPQAARPQAAAPSPANQTAGSGGGSGNDGSSGNGPGSGGGIGSGVGTGRGSGVGPGTGGGADQIYPPQVTNLAILPIPVPARVRPYRMVAHFDVDERGNARLIGFNPSRDRAYNNKIREMLSEVRFRPATRADGTPVRDTAQITAEAP